MPLSVSVYLSVFERTERGRGRIKKEEEEWLGKQTNKQTKKKKKKRGHGTFESTLIS